jgi:hypothetical protein
MVGVPRLWEEDDSEDSLSVRSVPPGPPPLNPPCPPPRSPESKVLEKIHEFPHILRDGENI